MIEIDNMFAVIIFIVAMVGIIGLTVYKMHKKNNGITLEAFLDEHYEHIISVLQDVVSILLVNIEDYPDKETYEKDIIRLTIEKLDNNCTDFGINMNMLKIIDKDALAEGIHNILTTEKVTVFTSTVPKQVMEENKELYDDQVLEVAEVLEVVNNEVKINNEVIKMEELTTEQKEVSEALDGIFEEAETIAEETLEYSIKTEHTAADTDDSVDTENKETEFNLDDINNELSKFCSKDTIENNVSNEDFDHFLNDPVPIVETAEQLADLAKMPNADVDSAMSNIKTVLNREHIDHE